MPFYTIFHASTKASASGRGIDCCRSNVFRDGSKDESSTDNDGHYFKDCQKSAFPDSNIAQKFQCCRNKATTIVECMAADMKSDLRQRIRSGPFTIQTDGSNEQRDKMYPVVITTATPTGVSTELLSVPTLNLQEPSTGIFFIQT